MLMVSAFIVGSLLGFTTFLGVPLLALLLGSVGCVAALGIAVYHQPRLLRMGRFYLLLLGALQPWPVVYLVRKLSFEQASYFIYGAVGSAAVLVITVLCITHLRESIRSSAVAK